MIKKIPFLLISLITLLGLQDTALAGTATYYHRSLAGRKMANGRRYNPNALTAASNRFPLGSTVIVTNKANGKRVRVRITDRCGNCYIDLSPAAFRRIASKSKGRVRISVRRG